MLRKRRGCDAGVTTRRSDGASFSSLGSRRSGTGRGVGEADGGLTHCTAIRRNLGELVTVGSKSSIAARLRVRGSTLSSLCASRHAARRNLFPPAAARKSRNCESGPKVAKSSFPICHPRQRAKLCRPRNCRISSDVEGPRNSVLPRSAAISGASKKFVGSFAVVTGDKGFTK